MAAAIRAFARRCTALKQTQRTLQIPTEQWAPKVTLQSPCSPQQREAPLNRTKTHHSAPHHHTALPVHGTSPPHDPAVASPRHPQQNYPHLTEEDMPGNQQCFFGTLECLQQSHTHTSLT